MTCRHTPQRGRTSTPTGTPVTRRNSEESPRHWRGTWRGGSRRAPLAGMENGVAAAGIGPRLLTGKRRPDDPASPLAGTHPKKLKQDCKRAHAQACAQQRAGGNGPGAHPQAGRRANHGAAHLRHVWVPGLQSPLFTRTDLTPKFRTRGPHTRSQTRTGGGST